MGFRGAEFAFTSPAAAVEGMLARLGVTPVEAGGSESGAGADARWGGAAEEVCELGRACGRILARDVIADRDSPAFDYSAMDGYAVCAGDVARVIAGEGAASGGVRLEVVGESRIGRSPPALPMRGVSSTGIGRASESGDEGVRAAAVRIATGAPIPRGADAVVKREDVSESESRPGFGPNESGEAASVGSIVVTSGVLRKLRAGDHIRRRGENTRVGDVVLRAGCVLSAASLGTLAAVGIEQPLVRAWLRVALITTGDELVPVSVVPGEYEIRNSNAAALMGLAGAHAWMDVSRVVHVKDDGDELSAALRAAVDECDAVVLSGGVSMGHRDPVRGAVEGVGAEVVFHGLPQRPGKPMLGAVVRLGRERPIPIFGLPGNPISAMVTWTRIVLPVLAGCAGAEKGAMRRGAPCALIEAARVKPIDFWWHRLVRIDEDGMAELVDGRGSGDIIAAGRCDGFIEVPPGEVPPGAARPGEVPNAEGREDARHEYRYYAWPT